jgi:hypothetical protein
LLWSGHSLDRSRANESTTAKRLIGLYAAVPRRASIMLRTLRIWMENNSRAITAALCFVLGAYFLIRGPSGP